SGLLGAPGTIYSGPLAARGLESNDNYIINNNFLTVDMSVTEPGDWIRVVTASDRVVPEPGTLLLLGTGLAGAAVARRRRNRSR
ncbi:MAG: PEP-CTERM sorting domain-containing protein, partial [Gemmatimonadota bacterium]|nr:PEP-CTERM sorting domain-containing protein [Gemmatimonadota bacterium]